MGLFDVVAERFQCFAAPTRRRDSPGAARRSRGARSMAPIAGARVRLPTSLATGGAGAAAE